MNAPATRSHQRRAARGAFAAALFALPVLGALLSILLPQGDAYGSGGLPLLAALGGLALTVCAGHLLARRVPFDHGSLARACAASSCGPLLAAPEPGDVTVRSGEPPPPVLLLLSSYFAFYAGLGGWVDGRASAREANDRLAGSPASR